MNTNKIVVYVYMKGYNCILNSIVFAVLLNIVLPIVVTPFATKEEKTPSNGANNLSYKGQFMHMIVHHGQVPFMSSIIVAFIVGLSVYLNYTFPLLR
jgi:hypothetical protein